MTEPKRFVVKLEKETESTNLFGLAIAAILIMLFGVLPARFMWHWMDSMFGPLTVRVKVVNVQK